MKRLKTTLLVLCAILCAATLYAASVSFPSLNVYSEIGSDGNLKTSYSIKMLVDTGLKYGVSVGFGLKQYDALGFSTASNTNWLEAVSMKIYAKPFDLFYVGYFLGNNCTLGDPEIGYRGFQFHQRPNLDYFGYHDIVGTGVEWYMNYLDIQETHILAYQPGISNAYNLDVLHYIRGDTFTLECYAGVNYTTNTWNKHLGFFIKSIFSKIDVTLGLYAPDNALTAVPMADEIYFNISEHIIYGWFEQTFGLFARPSTYNGYAESVSNDIDCYFAAGVQIENIGFGLENSFLMSSNHPITDRVGAYFYFNMNDLQYKLGAYYTPIGDAFASIYGGFINISGKL